MVRNDKVIALKRWKNEREKQILKFNLSKQTTIERATLFGFLAGDGSVKKRVADGVRYETKFFPDDDLMLGIFCHFFSLVYGIIPHVKPMKGHYEVRSAVSVVGQDLLSKAKFGIHEWSPPNFDSLEEKAAWLRGIFSAEGYVGEKSVRIQMVNGEGMAFVSQFLSELGIHHNKYLYRPKNPNHSTVHIITILRKSARELYAERIGFWHEAKTNKLTKALKALH